MSQLCASEFMQIVSACFLCACPHAAAAVKCLITSSQNINLPLIHLLVLPGIALFWDAGNNRDAVFLVSPDHFIMSEREIHFASVCRMMILHKDSLLF